MLAAAARSVELHHRCRLHGCRHFRLQKEKNFSVAFPDFGRGRPLTLGERKSLARTHDRSLIQRVVRDPHPDVIRILLDNPSLTEPDVVRICASRPCDPQVLQTVYETPSLGRSLSTAQRHRAKPEHAPRHGTASGSAAYVQRSFKEAATSSELAAPLRLSCRALLERRRRPSAAKPSNALLRLDLVVHDFGVFDPATRTAAEPACPLALRRCRRRCSGRASGFGSPCRCLRRFEAAVQRRKSASRSEKR